MTKTEQARIEHILGQVSKADRDFIIEVIQRPPVTFDEIMHPGLEAAIKGHPDTITAQKVLAEAVTQLLGDVDQWRTLALNATNSREQHRLEAGRLLADNKRMRDSAINLAAGLRKAASELHQSGNMLEEAVS